MSEQKAESKGFPRLFWIVNVMELFERGAYYGMNSVLAIYLSNKIADGGLGFAEDSVGFLQAVIYALTYIIPIAGGALAEKLGYRRMLIIAFLLLSSGYFAAGSFSTYGMVFASLGLMALGAGLFKPIISGSIARSTTESNSALGFGIYYWMINLGAFLGPIVVSIVKGFSWRYIFYASALYTFLMLIPAIFFFRDPDLPGKRISFKQTASNALMVLGDSRFMLMIFLYSFFWIIYFQTFGSVLWFLRDFIDREPVNRFLTNLLGFRFELGEEMVTIINAGTIILLQVWISRLFRKARAIPTICTGILIGSLAFLLLAFSRNPWVFVAAMAVFSIGEMTAHPKYYSYVGLVAPQERKAVYMGYAFLYGVIGSLFGSSFGAVLYLRMAKPGNTRLFFSILFLLGMIGFAGLLLYDRFFSQDTPRNRRRARRVILFIYGAAAVSGMWMLVSALRSSPVSYKQMIQAAILVLIGIFGFWVAKRHSGIMPGNDVEPK